MRICPSCGVDRPDDGEILCLFHSRDVGDNFAAYNRVWCNYFHRGVSLPPRVIEPGDDVSHVGASAPDPLPLFQPTDDLPM